MKQLLYRCITGCMLAGWMIMIFAFSSQPAYESDKVSTTVAYRVVSVCNEIFDAGMSDETKELVAANINYPIRKAAHMTEYAILGLLFFFCMLGYVSEKRRIYVSALCLTACYAATDEIHQLFVAGRAGRLSDVCIDTLGALIALFLLYQLRRLISVKRIGKHCEK